MDQVDVVVIGAGVLGCAVARELSRYALDVLVLERAHDVGEGSSKANSGIVHAGFHPRAGSLKGRSCVEGNAVLRQWCAELEVPLVACGGMMVAFDDEGMKKLQEKMERGRVNGAIGLEIVDGAVALALEPRLNPRVIAALMAPTTGIVSPFQLVLGLAENAAANGVDFRFSSAVERIERTRDGWRLHTTGGEGVEARYVVNAAGDAAALLDAQVHPADYEVRPRLGEYLVFDVQEPDTAITHVIYQAAESDEGGTLVAPTVDGNLLAGPTSTDTDDFTSAASTAEGLAHVWRVASKVIPDLRREDVIRNFAGVRTNIVNVSRELKDFVVRLSAPGFVSALGIKNPGLTASPVLARRAIALLEEDGLELRSDGAFQAQRTRYVPFLERTETEQRILLDGDPAYGRIVCRCEGVTEGDVRALAASLLPPSTLTGVKRRLRCGMGRCQGQFCEPRVADTVARQWGVPLSEVPACERGGRVAIRAVK